MLRASYRECFMLWQNFVEHSAREFGLSQWDGFSSLLKTLSPFISLLKVHLQLHGFSVFLDVEKLEAGKFEDKLIQSVMSARNFVLVLSPGALDKCMGDTERQDWVHKVCENCICWVARSNRRTAGRTHDLGINLSSPWKGRNAFNLTCGFAIRQPGHFSLSPSSAIWR